MHETPSPATSAREQALCLLSEELDERGATELLIEPGEDDARIRVRIDGKLRVAKHIVPRRQLPALVSKLKQLAGLDRAERRLPQEGRITFPDRRYAVTTLPLWHGELVSVRPIEPRDEDELSRSGLDGEEWRAVGRALRRKNGLILVAGVGSQVRSDFVRACLRRVASPGASVVTIDNAVPVGVVDGVQSTVPHPLVGLDARALLDTAVLCDADIVAIPWFGDAELVRRALEVAHSKLILGGVPVGRPVATLRRFLEMGVEPWALADAFVLVVSVRFARRLCGDCKVAVRAPSPADLERLAPRLADIPWERAFEPRGCAACGGTGFRGQVPIVEVLERDKETVSLLSRSALDEIEERLPAKLIELALVRAISGETSIVEAARAVGPWI